MKKNNLRCFVCESFDKKLLFKKNKYDFYKCNRCDIVNINPIPSIKILDKYYASKNKLGLNYDVTQYQEKKYVDYDFCEHIISSTRFNKSDYILDIGCYCGQLLDAYKNKGYMNLYGIEMQLKAYSIAKNKHNNIFNITLEKFCKNNNYRGKFDYIIASGLIEHLRDPIILFQSSKFLLKDNGYLIIQTPFADSILAKVFSKYWPPYTAPEHINYFTQKSFDILLSKYNFRKISLKRHFKKLKIDYVFKMFRTFGTDLLFFIKFLEKITPNFIKNTFLIFYGGEKIIICQKKNSVQNKYY